MAIDRDEALRKAEKLLRQGRLDGAIAEYERIIQAFPDDIATAGALGDLYGRAGQAGQAVGQYIRIGDHWLREGMRHTDIAGYLGNGRYVVIMPEADQAAAETAIARMKAEGIATDAGLAYFPEGGETFEALYRAASAQLPPALRHAA